MSSKFETLWERGNSQAEKRRCSVESSWPATTSQEAFRALTSLSFYRHEPRAGRDIAVSGARPELVPIGPVREFVRKGVAHVFSQSLCNFKPRNSRECRR